MDRVVDWFWRKWGPWGGEIAMCVALAIIPLLFIALVRLAFWAF